MVAEDIPLSINNLALSVFYLSMIFKKLSIIPACDKAYVLTVRLIRHLYIHVFCNISNPTLRHRTEWKDKTLKFVLSKGKKKVRLILTLVICFTEIKPLSFLIGFYSCIMTRGKMDSAAFPRPP